MCGEGYVQWSEWGILYSRTVGILWAKIGVFWHCPCIGLYGI